MGDRFIRVDADFGWHPKTLELERLLEHVGAGGLVVNLWCWAALHRPGGALLNMTARDIAAAARWPGDPQKLVAALMNCGGERPGFLEEADGAFILHDWREKQEYFASAETRWRACEKKQRQRLSEKCPPRSGDSSGTVSPECPPAEGDRAGTMSPECPPSEKRREDQRREDLSTPPTPPSGGTALDRPNGFDAFWRVFPRKVGKAAALRVWKRLHPTAELAARIVAAVEAQRSWPQWIKESGQFIPNPATWLNQGRWEDEPLGPASAGGPDVSRFKALMEDAHAPEDDR